MRPPLHQRFVDKAQATMTAAVEVHNKPFFCGADIAYLPMGQASRAWWKGSIGPTAPCPQTSGAEP